ncbi:DUF2283 domain-containing protein [Arthrobacter sp. NPDC080073]|uniref:DUF2283 domain-containing protein n=1 Tax=Arthrobacter sp. NPDC080073 TaxID=3155919 RepID=UPI003412FBD7
MRISYDPEARAAYVSLLGAIEDGSSVRQLGPIDLPGGDGQIVVDLDRDGHILGFEILNADLALSPEVNAKASNPGE